MIDITYIILVKFWLFLVPLFCLAMLFRNADFLLRFFLPYFPKNTRNFVLRYVKLVYGRNLVYYFNLVHIFFFTFFGFFLRYKLIEDSSLLSDYWAYFIVYFIFGAAVRLCDTVFCFFFLFCNYRTTYSFFTFEVNSEYENTLYQRIVIARVFKGACTAFGICVTGIGTWLAYKRYKKENYAECLRAHAQLWDQWRDNAFDSKTYLEKWEELKKKHGINKNNEKDFERYQEQNYAEYSRLREQLYMQWFNNIINSETHHEKWEELKKKHGITEFEENFNYYKREPRKSK